MQQNVKHILAAAENIINIEAEISDFEIRSDVSRKTHGTADRPTTSCRYFQLQWQGVRCRLLTWSLVDPKHRGGDILRIHQICVFLGLRYVCHR